MSQSAMHMHDSPRIPPQALEIEENVLGTMMVESFYADKVFEILQEEDFYKSLHRSVFRAMSELQMDGKDIDLLTVEQKLKDMDVNFSTVELSDLTRVSSGGNIEYHCQIIREKSIIRNLILFCNQLAKKGYESGTDAYDLVDEAQELMFSLIDQNEGRLHDISDVMQRVVKKIAHIQETGESIGLETGLDIDGILNGFQDGKLYVIGARPSMGKTAFVITLMKAMATRGIKNGLISLETTSESVGVRLLSQESTIPAEKLVKPVLTDVEMNAIMDAAGALSAKGIMIDDSTNVTEQQIRSKCRIMKQKGCKIIFIDFLTLIKKIGRSKHEEIGDIMKALKSISKELNIPVVLLAQLSREVEKRSDKRPMLSDLRESGSIEEDADGILFLYRDEYYGINTDKDGNSTDGILEIIIAKNKDGKIGLKKQYFNKETMTVHNLSEFSNEPRRI